MTKEASLAARSSSPFPVTLQPPSGCQSRGVTERSQACAGHKCSSHTNNLYRQITLLFTLSVEVVKENYLFRSGIQSYMTETPTEEFFIASIKCFYSLFSPARTANSCFFNSDLHPFVFFHFSVSLQQLVSGFFLAIKCSLSPSDLEKQLS